MLVSGYWSPNIN